MPTTPTSTHQTHRVLTPFTAALGATAFTTAVVKRMEDDYRRTETFTAPTVGLLYSAYAATGGALAWAARRRSWPLPLPSRAARIAGIGFAATGTTLAGAGASRFASPTQLSGTDPGTLITGGLYRHTRNPQYLGLTAALAGIALAARSGLAAVLTASTWITFNRWIPNEERHLERLFVDEYRALARTTPRWLRLRPASP